jgi:hypothetical protein
METTALAVLPDAPADAQEFKQQFYNQLKKTGVVSSLKVIIYQERQHMA